jgi:hypothetical protein
MKGFRTCLISNKKKSSTAERKSRQFPSILYKLPKKKQLRVKSNLTPAGKMTNLLVTLFSLKVAERSELKARSEALRHKTKFEIF